MITNKFTNKLLVAFATLAVGMMASTLLLPISAAALSGSDFQAGHIIDDSVFTNSSSMSVAQIQSFLDSKVSCDTNGAQPKSYYYNSSTGAVNNGGTWVTTTRAIYGQRYDAYYNTTIAAAPYVCLPQYVENPSTLQNNLQNPGAVISGGQSAAQIIYSAGQQYGINPQVIITTLQKEQGLVTDDWPWTNEYKIAMGYACPDTAPCNSQYYGFANQVTSAAAQFRNYLNNPNNFNYVIGNNYILYSPNTSCGGSNVYIQNQATGALYDYTPYQPNAAALANTSSTSTGGTGDSCSSYGNRNFWWYFTTWFGSATGPGYSFVSAVSPSLTPAPGQVMTGIQIKLLNQSGATWYSDGSVPVGYHPTRLAMPRYAANPYANTADPAWLGTNNQIKMDQASVASGSYATFTFSLKGPYQAISNYVMHMVPVLDGIGFYQDIGMQWILSTPTPNTSFQIVSTTPLPASSPSGTSTQVTVSAKNTGNTMWYGDSGTAPIGSHPTRLYTVGPAYHPSQFYDSTTWLANNQVKLQQQTVSPGQTGTFVFNAITPVGVGTVSDNFGLITDGVTPLSGTPATLTTTINDYQYEIVSSTLPSSLSPGEQTTAKIILKNTGTKTWYADGSVPNGGHAFRLATAGYQSNPLAIGNYSAWLGTLSQIKMVTSSVAPGSTGEFDIPLAAPYKSGTYNQNFMPVVDGEFFLGGSVSSNLVVPDVTGTYTTSTGSVGAPSVMTPGQIANIKLLIKNDTNAVWYADGSTPSNFKGGATRIVMYNPYYRSTVFANSTDSAWLGTASQIKMTTPIVGPGQTGEFDYTWKAPQQTGAYKEEFSLVIDGYQLLPFVDMQFVTTVQ